MKSRFLGQDEVIDCIEWIEEHVGTKKFHAYFVSSSGMFSDLFDSMHDLQLAKEVRIMFPAMNEAEYLTMKCEESDVMVQFKLIWG